jgi:thiamine-phosphate pyrophosphorylase
MQTEIFLIAPADAETAAFTASLKDILARTEVSALLLQRGARSENGYKDFVKAVAPVAQAKNCAVLIEGEPGLVKLLGVDGLHVSDGVTAVREAIAALKPQMIVGAGDINSRDDAMTAGELDVDYILFGPLSGSIKPAERELARWWTETMQVPSVLSDPEAGLDGFDAEGCEFIGLSAPALEPAR